MGLLDSVRKLVSSEPEQNAWETYKQEQKMTWRDISKRMATRQIDTPEAAPAKQFSSRHEIETHFRIGSAGIAPVTELTPGARQFIEQNSERWPGQSRSVAEDRETIHEHRQRQIQHGIQQPKLPLSEYESAHDFLKHDINSDPHIRRALQKDLAIQVFTHHPDSQLADIYRQRFSNLAVRVQETVNRPSPQQQELARQRFISQQFAQQSGMGMGM